MAFEIKFDRDAIKDLKKLDRPIQQRLVGFLKTRVARLDDPSDIGEALSEAKRGNYWIAALSSECCGSETAVRSIGEAGGKGRGLLARDRTDIRSALMSKSRPDSSR